MSALRTRLETAQARVKQLEAELRDFPAISTERVALQALLTELAATRAETEHALARTQLEQEALRVRLSHSPWWRSAWLIPFGVAGLLSSLFAAVWAIDHLNWAGLAWTFGWVFGFAPLVINLTRYARGRWKLARRRQLGGGMKTE